MKSSRRRPLDPSAAFAVCGLAPEFPRCLTPLLLPLFGLALVSLPTAAFGTASPPAAKGPNVLLIMTDDQGYGELSCHGNPVLQTPHLDQLAAQSVRLTDFHVAPMCTPTRGQLLTGVDSLRNGAMNVSSGRTLLRREYPTLANLFADSGYRTGLFGKWHLGDSYPFRPQDRGFHESLWFPSSHIGSVPDAWENDYFDDTYLRSGQRQVCEGYTTDVFFREAIRWIQAQSRAGRPFFCYLATAAPHWPHFVPDRYRAPIRAAFQKSGLPPLAGGQQDELISYLAMIANIDENLGTLERFLDESGLREDTIVVFLTDNGSTFGPRYFNAGMKGGKVTLWEGGHRVPCFIRWPAGRLCTPGDVSGLTQVQDLLPTLVELCGLTQPAAARFDGLSLAGVLRGTSAVPEDRMLVINYSRMPHGILQPTLDNPAVPRREGAAVLWKRWRLLEDRQLYDLAADPLQERNLIDQRPQVVAAMRAHLDAWWRGVADRINDFESVAVGDPAQNPVTLTACDWADVFVDQQVQVRRGERKNGIWHLEVAVAGDYAFELSRWPPDAHLRLTDSVAETRVADGTLTAGPGLPIAAARIRVGDLERTSPAAAAAGSVRFMLPLKAGRTTLQTWFLDDAGAELCGAYYVQAERLAAPGE